MTNRIDLNKWERKDIYNFFKNFTEPFFGLTVTINCTKAYKYCKENQQSFFLYYLHKSLVAANSIESFKYRIINDEVIIFDKVNASATINRPNNTFGFSYINFEKDYINFEKEAKKEIENIQNSKGLIPAVSGENVIHYSSIPWIDFTSLSHARNFTFNDSCPKISFGKITEQNGKKEMPMSVHVHHALLDGFHVGQYIDLFQKLMNEQ